MIKGLIFDYGGTLDTHGNHWGRVIYHAYQHHLPIITWEQFRSAYVYGERTLGRNPIVRPTFNFRQTLDVKLRLQMENLTMQRCWQPTADEFKQIHRRILDELYGQVRETMNESREVLYQLQNRQVPMVLVSNFYGNLSVVLKEMNIENYFLDVIESAVVGIRKPDSKIFYMGMQALSRQCNENLKPDDILVVGDSLNKDILPATLLGFQTAFYQGEQWDGEDSTTPLPTGCVKIDSLQSLIQFPFFIPS